MKIDVLYILKKWPDEETLKVYAEKCNMVLLPSGNNSNIESLASKLFDKVYCARKSGKYDDGWKAIKV